ncbi:uncharacterized protein LOC134253982, partial [Saccostrea cucullata]|uniref:uncharacterized protein LOC134253982 n=1 Tax=Saccostrea cuccullata TaxID=36930 RepID=UPI002ED13C6D
MKHRSREKDFLAIKSKIGKCNIVSESENVVLFSVSIYGFYENDWVCNCLTFNNDYDKFFKVTPPEVLRKCVPYMTNIQETILCSSEISDIVLKFGLDFVCFFHTCSKYSKIYEDGLNIMNLPRHVVDMSVNVDGINEFSEFKQYVDKIMKCEHKSLKSLNLNSLLGSYLIGREKGKEKALDSLGLSHTKWNILVSILMSESYSLSLNSSWEEILTSLQSVFPLLRCESRMLDSDIAELTDIYKVLKKENNSVRFISDDVRHQVMSYFVKNCLITDENYENYIKLSSEDSLLEYVRPWWYMEKEWCMESEKYLFLPESLEDLFIQRLGLDVLRHVIVDWNNRTEDRIKKVREAFQEKFKLPSIVFCETNRKIFVEYVKKISKEKQVSMQSLNLNSLFGSFLIGRDDYSSEVPEILALSQTKKSILVSILISESYSLSLSTTWEEMSRKLQSAFPLLKCDSKTLDSDITELKDISKVLNKENNSVRFISDDVRHQVMSYFVRNCLITDEDYENYIKLSSVDSLLEYVRPWWYMVETDLKKWLFLPETLEDSFFQRLGLDVLRHPTIKRFGECDEETTDTFREKVKDNFNVPEEIFGWEYGARYRYIECAKRGTKTVHRARAMIVGCAGAGKTTLLKRLEKLGLEELLKVDSTVGLEVHEDMFELDEDSCLRALSDSTNKDDKHILSVVDFGGQCAYYARHQVYFSTFYLLVIDMSKPFTETVDENKCEQRETMFADWTYGEYVLFWLKSIHTYCAEDTSVIVVATHSENATQKEKDGFYGQLLDLLPTDSNLKKHLKFERCFFVNFPCDKGEELEYLSDLEKYIVSIAKDRRWKENIPKEWSVIELAFITMRRSKKIVPIEELKEKYWKAKRDDGLKMEDALCFFHDIGLILHFKEENLSNTIIVDVQWFVDTFKFVISDKNHVRDLAETDKEWQYFHRTGYLMDNFLSRVWGSLYINSRERPIILQYMQRLGLLAIGDLKHYVPCMNKKDFGRKERIALRGMETKSSVLVLHFHFLPFFFYCRLIVACIVRTEWKVVEDKGLPGLYKNVAIFVYRDHLIALVVTQTAIQVQILRPQNSPIDANVAVHIKETLENRLGYLTSTFHKKVAYNIAFQCSYQDVLCESEECYVYEKELISKNDKILCPRHGFPESHEINIKSLTKFWNR